MESLLMETPFSGADLFDELAYRSQKSMLVFEQEQVSAVHFFEQARQLGKKWQQQGVCSYDVVASCGSKQWLLQSLLAALSIDGIFCPVAPQWQGKDLVPIFSSKKIWWHSTGDSLGAFEGSYVPWQFLEKMSCPCLLLRTSASFSEGKWVGYEASHLWQQLKIHDQKLPSISDSRLQVLPLYHTFGLVLDLLVGLYRGQNVHLIEMESVSHGLWLKKLPETFWDIALTPRLAYLGARFMESKQKKNALLHVGGAPLTRSCQSICEKSFEVVVEGYGLTECGPGVLLNGKEIEGVELRVDPVCEDVGVLWIKSSMMGLWQEQPEQLVSGWFCSQDLVKFQDGKWNIIGRACRSFKQSDGRWGHLDEIEHLICNNLQLTALKIEPVSFGGWRVLMLAEESSKAWCTQSFLQEKMGLEVFIELVREGELLQKTSKTIL